MKMLLEDIKNQTFKNIYLFCGEEAYLRNQYKHKLRNALLPEDDTINFSHFEGKNINVREIIDLAETLPFFAERRLIFIENSGFFKNKCDDLADYLPAMPDSTCLLFVETEVDKRNRLYKTVKDQGRIVEFQVQDEKTLTKWILGTLGRENKRITQSTLQLFLTKTGTDMENISMELEKLLSFTLNKDTITSEDVETICTTQTVNKIFDMMNAIAEKHQKKALALYYDLLALKEPPMRILFLIARQFNQLLTIRHLMNKGYDKSLIAGKAGIAPFIAGKYMLQAKSFTVGQLEIALKDCVDSEEAVKTGRMNDIMSVELLIVKYSV